MNNLTEEKRKHFKIAVIAFTLLFVLIYGIVMYVKYSLPKNTATKNQENAQIIFKQPTLQFFQYKTALKTYPDRIAIHAPYLIVTRPDEFRSEIYNIETKQKEKELSEITLDYVAGGRIYNKHGYQTYFNDTDLGTLCDRAFIKSTSEILCVTRPNKDSPANKLISINPQTLEQKDIYESQNVITAIYYDKYSLYIGEYDFEQNKAFITVANQTAPIDDLINIIYPIDEQMYAASFKSLRNKQVESYYQIINTDNKMETKLKEKGQIIFR